MAIDRWKVFKALGYEKTIDTTHFGRRKYPVPEVRRFHDSNATIKVCLAPARTGKSYSGAWDMVPDILDFDRPLKWAKHLIVGPDYDKASKEFHYIAEALVHNRGKLKRDTGIDIPAPVSFFNQPKTGRMEIVWPWGAELHAKSTKNFSALLGDQWGTCLISETSQVEASVFFRGLRTRCQRFIWPTTPDVRGMWIKDFCEEMIADQNPGLEVFKYPPESNPDYDMDRYEEALKEMGPDDPRFQEQFRGEWVFYGGRVFQQFQASPVEDISRHINPRGIGGGEGHICIQPLPMPHDWKRIAGMDFGWNDETCHLWAACAPDGTVIIYDEYYQNQRGSRAHIEAIEAQSVLNGTPKITDRVREAHGQSKQIAEDMQIEYKFYCRPVESNRLALRLQIANYLDRSGPKNLPKLRIIKENCPNLVRELLGLHYDEQRIHREGRREFYLGDDHAVDPLGYLLSTRPKTHTVTKTSYNGMTLDVLKRHAVRMRKRKNLIGRDRKVASSLYG